MTASPTRRTSSTSEVVLLVFLLILGAEPFTSSGPVVFGISVAALGYFSLAGPIRLPPLPVLGFLAWCFLSVLWSVAPSLTLRGAVVTTITTTVMFIAVSQIGRDALLRTLARAFKIMIAASWLLYVAVPAVGREQSVHPGALKGIFVQRNTAAFVIGAAVLTFLYLAMTGTGRARAAWLWSLAAVVSVLAAESGTGLAVMTVSSVLLVLTLALHRRSSFERLSLTLVVGLAGAAMITVVMSGIAGAAQLLGRDTSLTGRTVIWEAIGPYARSEQWTGYGWGALWTPETFVTRQIWGKAHFEFSHAHNAFLDMILQVGLLGTALALVALVVIVSSAVRRYLTGDASAAAYSLALVAYLLAYGLSERSFVSYFGWILLMAAYALMKLPAEERAAGPAVSARRDGALVAPRSRMTQRVT